MKKFQSTNNGKSYEMYPFRGYVSLIFYLVIFLIVISAVAVPFISDGFQLVESLKLAFFSLLICLVIFSPIFLFLYKFSYHIDWEEKKIYKKIFFYKKLKMKAENLEIDQEHYKIIDKTDRFSNEINLMFFGTKANEIDENTIELFSLFNKKWLGITDKQTPEKILRPETLTFFKKIDNKQFELVKPNKLNTILFVLFFLGFLYQMYNLQSKISTDISFLDFITVIPALVFLVMISSRIIFNLEEKMAYTKFLWVIPYEKMDLTRFHNFEVTKHHTNGIYTGTSLSMLFSKKTNQNKFRNLTIWSATKNTKNFEEVMTKIRFLLSKMS